MKQILELSIQLNWFYSQFTGCTKNIGLGSYSGKFPKEEYCTLMLCFVLVYLPWGVAKVSVAGDLQRAEGLILLYFLFQAATGDGFLESLSSATWRAPTRRGRRLRRKRREAAAAGDRSSGELGYSFWEKAEL